MSSGYARRDEDMLWLARFQEASLCMFKCDSSIQHFVIINYSGILSDPISTKKPPDVFWDFVITRKSYVFEKYFARLRKPLKVSKQLREDVLPNSSKKTICIIVYSNLQPSMFHVKDFLAYSFFSCI